MKSDPMNVNKIFSNGGAIHYVLPHFQRHYSWGEKNWTTLLKDIVTIYENYSENSKVEHFLGSIVTIENGMVGGNIPQFKLVDGQQRLITISLALCAFRDLLSNSNTRISKKLNKLLVNDEYDDEKDNAVYLKLLPTNKYGDQQAYRTLITGTEPKALSGSISSIPTAYEFFYREFDSYFRSEELLPDKLQDSLLNAFHVVFITLNPDESPYKIFESLNAKGRPLTQADLVRNYIAMKLPNNRQEKIFNQDWEPIESKLKEKRIVGKSRIGEMTAFIRHYLAMRSHILCTEESIYERFRDRCESLSLDGLLEEIQSLKFFADYYSKLLRPQEEENVTVRVALERLAILDNSTAYPFLLNAYSEWKKGTLASDQLVDLLGLPGFG